MNWNEIKFNPIHNSWKDLFQELYNDEHYKELENKLTDISKNSIIYPEKTCIFKAFHITGLDDLKVVFIGQDPYFNPGEAMGLAFSVPVNIAIPSSLKNIYKNLIKFNHIKKEKNNGDLQYWAYQGCLLLNTALTVQHGMPNSHTKYWSWFSDKIIKYISDKCDRIIFVIWGSKAYDKINLIDRTKHKCIISSHPSGLSASKKFREFPAFNDFDHFGEINKILNEWNKNKILW